MAAVSRTLERSVPPWSDSFGASVSAIIHAGE